MPKLFTMKMNDWSASRSFTGNKICTTRDEPKCDVGDIFPLTYSNNKTYYRIIDIWEVPRDFIIKFLWRLEGAQSQDELSNILTEIYPNDNTLYAHFYNEMSYPEDVILNMVKSND